VGRLAPVEADEQYGARLAVEHLAHLGHRRIAFINGPKGWYASDNRLLGYQATLAQLDIAFDPEIVLEGDWDVPGGSLATKKLLSLPQPPTAIFAANDFMALGAMYALREAGLRVPEDVAIVGYDDREICRLAQPTIHYGGNALLRNGPGGSGSTTSHRF
jgi:LacI family transcriptional regulator